MLKACGFVPFLLYKNMSGGIHMRTRIDDIINDYLLNLALHDDLDGTVIKTLIAVVREKFRFDCVFVFENLAFRNDFVYSYYNTDDKSEDKAGVIVQLTDSEYEERLSMYDENNMREDVIVNEDNATSCRYISTLRYGMITGETYYGSVCFRKYNNAGWNPEEREALKKLGRVLRICLDSKYRRRLREQRSQKVLKTLECNFNCIYYANFKDGTMQTINSGKSSADIKYYSAYDEWLRDYSEGICDSDAVERFLTVFCRDNLINKLDYRNSKIEDVYKVNNNGIKWERIDAVIADTDGQENVYHVVITIVDVTNMYNKLEELNAQLIAANKAKSDFLAQMSHDIRTPMNAVLGYVELSKKDIDNKEKQHEYLGKIEYSGKMLVSLLNDILDLSKIESGRMDISHEPYNIYECVNSSVEMFESNARIKNLDMSVDVDIRKDCMVSGDIVRMSQILNNIISNAVKYTNYGGISIRCSLLDGNFTFICKDSGIGMDKEFLDKIFEPYTRDTANVSGISGTGLGMAITCRLVELMNGTINVNSKPGCGTIFTIVIPVNIVDEMPVSETESDDVSVLAGKRVLLVEDNEINIEIVTQMLDSFGIIVDTAENGKDAVYKVKIHAAGYYNLVFMDIQMPVMNGYDAAKSIREFDDKDKASVPIIAMSGNAYAKDKEDARNAGMTGYMCKPVSMKELQKLLIKSLI